MITLFKGKQVDWDLKDKPDYIVNCAERFAVALDAHPLYFGIYCGRQLKSKQGEWSNSLYSYKGLFLNFRNFDLGSSHIYYDGPHCMFSMGFLHYSWEPAHCDKCYKEYSDNEDDEDYSDTWFKKRLEKIKLWISKK